jgi:hypothetical protein
MRKRMGSESFLTLTPLATYVKCTESEEDTNAHVRVVAQTAVMLLTNTEGEGGDDYHPLMRDSSLMGNLAFCVFGMMK